MREPCLHGTPAGETCPKCGALGQIAAALMIKGLTGKWPAELTHRGRTPQLGDTVNIRATRVRGENTYCVGFERFTVPAAAEVTVIAPAQCDECETNGRNCRAHACADCDSKSRRCPVHDPIGPQADADGDDSTPCGAVIRVGDEVVGCSYDEGHSGDHFDGTGNAWSELGLRLPDPWGDDEPSDGDESDELERLRGEVEQLRAAVADQRDRADRLEVLVHHFVAARAEYIVAIENCHPDRPHDYWRWQGHAEARRQLGEQLDKLRASAEEVATDGQS